MVAEFIGIRPLCSLPILLFLPRFRSPVAFQIPLLAAAPSQADASTLF